MSQWITISPYRTIGDIFVDCSIEETHSDTLTITDHPTEVGASVTDHAYKEPAELTMFVGFSNSSKKSEGDETYVQRIYDALLALQNSRETFRVVTGKRIYTNMLIRNISVTTDSTTEAALMCQVNFREIMRAVVTTTNLLVSENQAAPEKTAPPVSKGTTQAAPVSDFPTSSPVSGWLEGAGLVSI